MSVAAQRVSFNLVRNFPNPFNPSTNITFSLEQAETISLSVFDATGREVAVVYSAQLLDAGQHSVSFDATAPERHLLCTPQHLGRDHDGAYGAREIVRTLTLCVKGPAIRQGLFYCPVRLRLPPFSTFQIEQSLSYSHPQIPAQRRFHTKLRVTIAEIRIARSTQAVPHESQGLKKKGPTGDGGP